jgi:hypothetical protein
MKSQCDYAYIAPPFQWDRTYIIYIMPLADVRQTIVRRSTNDLLTFDKQLADVRQTMTHHRLQICHTID